METTDTTFKDWMRHNFERHEIEDIANYGADAGWSGLTYYSDTSDLYNQYKSEIWDLAIDQADEFGHKNVFEFLGTFNAANVSNCTEIENLMVWFAAEHYARELAEEAGEGNGDETE